MDLNGLSPAFQDALGPFLEAGGLGVNSGYRSPDQQAQIISNHFGKYGFSASDRAAWDSDVASLGAVGAGQQWADRLSASGMRKWIAIPGGSNHQRGLAADLYFPDDAARQWAHDHAADYGLTFPMSWEPWHVELAGARDGTAQPLSGGGNVLQPAKDHSADAPKVDGNALAYLALDRMRRERENTQNALTGALPFRMV